MGQVNAAAYLAQQAQAEHKDLAEKFLINDRTHVTSLDDLYYRYSYGYYHTLD